jgi:NADPH:quinone reductase-like Zn-dependent oxidoreductase
MKAIVYNEHGGPEVLECKDVPEPRLSAAADGKAVLVRIRACALNHLDLWIRRGIPGQKTPMPHIPGSDVAGEVAAVGEGVTNVKSGDRVMLHPGISCGQCEKCLAGSDNLCRAFTVLGQGVDGGCAEFVKVPAVNCVPIPATLSWEEAAAFPLVATTAWHMVMTRAALRPAETVLVLAAGSGVGMMALQIAKAAGARVIATAGTDAKLAKARELGADETINHYTQKISDEVKRLTGKRGVQVVVEHVGQATWAESIRSLEPGGRLVTCGATTGYEGAIDIRYLFTRQISLLGSYMGSKSELYPALELMLRGKIKPVIDVVWPLERCADAHRRLESGEQFGKVVLKVE